MRQAPRTPSRFCALQEAGTHFDHHRDRRPAVKRSSEFELGAALKIKGANLSSNVRREFIWQERRVLVDCVRTVNAPARESTPDGRRRQACSRRVEEISIAHQFDHELDQTWSAQLTRHDRSVHQSVR